MTEKTETKKMNINEKLLAIQSELKAPKGQYNSFGKYKYRSAEDILEAVKPLCAKYKALVILTDTTKVVGTEKATTRTTAKDGTITETCTESLRTYINAMAQFIDTETGDNLVVNAEAREPQTKTGMDASQITGTASSYARKYALNGLFCIDDTKDADTDEYHKQTTKTVAKSVAEYMGDIDNAETEQEINNLFYEWSKIYVKGTDDYKTLTNKSFERKKQIVGA
jgi:hypothetical protein